ncbi:MULTISPECIES: hypothetical protein [unclassified Coleofasciculus]|uniref:hypothetical protein n=1 Tax=unclassified Coleofasciculus TaxID=2692782 RepID=UPI001882DA3E|nr:MULTISPECIES: hypothetical protein [unclassified Coleofasciculus]MBE9125802.1 hypothetical protein [Coleofasciculus sp. LEGE 07081]MBE9149013.1 hypothetical protein [Coleofasciculus sp. LEGE 07092]
MWKPLKLTSWLAVAAVAWSIGYVYNVRYGGELSWLRMMYEEKIALADQIEAPRRLLITGGSGAHYTINSELLEQELGIPVLNLGIDGPVGLDVILPSILDKVRPGDIVLLIPEYLILWSEDGLGDRSAQFGMAIGRPGLGGIPPKQLAQQALLLGTPTLRAATKSAFEVIQTGKMTGYYSDPVDERGDPTVTKERTGKWWELPINEPASKHTIQRIAKFREEVEAKGATLVLSLPWVYARTDEKSVNNVKKTAEELAKIAPLIYDKESLNMKTDSSLFADTHYHLLPESREIRAEEIAKQLRAVIGMQREAPDSSKKLPQ